MKLLFTIFLTFIFYDVLAQVNIVSKEYYESIESGKYINLSSDATTLKSVTNAIQPQLSTLILDSNIAFIFPPKNGILFFKSLKNKNNIAGKLLNPSLIKVDTVFYNSVYKNVDTFSFDVWFAVNINGNVYYTDYQIHDFIPFKFKLANQKQLFTLVGQSTGYDNYYDNGYPDNFHVVVFEEAKNSMKIIYSSEELPLDYGDEFWENESSMKYNYRQDTKEIEFTIFGEIPYSGIWDGKTLRKL